MSRRFSTDAANADVLGEDVPMATPDASPTAADGTLGDRANRKAPREGELGGDQAKPGKDINAPGFIKDEDATKP